MPDVSIPLTGLATNDPEPGTYVEINFGTGPMSGAAGLRPMLLIGNKSTAGDATPDTTIYGPPSPFTPASPLPMGNEQDVINRFGQGSELHRMWRRATTINKTTPIYAIAVSESTGAAATLAITIAVTATANGSARTWIGDEFVDAPITIGDTPTIIAANIVLAINSKLNWAVTATASVGAITITAKNKGLRGNWLRGSCNIIGTSVGTTSSVAVPTYFTSGTTADSNTTALGNLINLRFYYCVSAAEDATQFGALVAQLGTAALPTTGLRQRAFAGSIDTLSNLTTIATGINAVRAEIPWCEQADWTPAEIAANAAAIYALFEASSIPRLNFSQFGFSANDATLWLMRAPRSGKTPSRASRVSALNNGITVIGVLQNGQTYLDKRVTTRCLSGANQDFRARDAHKVTVSDFFADDLVAKDQAMYNGKNIGADAKTGQRLPPNTVSPKARKSSIFKLIDVYADNGLLQNAAAIQVGTIVNREPGTSSRISASIPLTPADILDQLSTQINES